MSQLCESWACPAGIRCFLDCAGASCLRRHPRTRAARAASSHRLAPPRGDRGADPARRRLRPARQAGAVTGGPRGARPRHPGAAAVAAELAGVRRRAVGVGAGLLRRWWPMARCCATACSRCPRAAGSTCTSRCCPPGAARRRCRPRSPRGTPSPGRRRSRSSRAWTPGPVYGVVTETIRPTDTAGDLLERLAISGAALLSTTLDGIADGTLTPRPQPADGVSIAPKITVEQARVRWDLPAPVVERRIRAVTPNPGAWTLIGDLRVKLGPVQIDARPQNPCRPAQFTSTAKACGSAPARSRCGWARFSRPARNS